MRAIITNWQFDPQSLKGRTLEEAQLKAQENGYRTRVTRRDGQAYVITADFREDRLNFELKENIVSRVEVG